MYATVKVHVLLRGEQMGAPENSWLSQVMTLAMATFVSVLGILARFAQGAAATGKIEWRSFWIACLTAPALGIMAAGLGSWLGTPWMLNAAIEGFIGFVGPAFVQVFVGRFLDSWIYRSNNPPPQGPLP